MLTSTFVKNLSAVLEAAIANNKLSSDPHIAKIQNLIIKEFRGLVRQFKDDTSELTVEQCSPFKQFLNEIGTKIAHTKAGYFTSANNFVNQFLITMANQLSAIVKIHPWKLLVPTLQSTTCVNTNVDLATLQPHQVVLTDDGTKCFDLFALLRHAEKNNGVLELVEDAGLNKRPLSVTERMRSIFHSKLSTGYFNAIRSNKGEADARRLLKDALKRNAYETNNTYGAQVEPDLIRMISAWEKTLADEMVELTVDEQPTDEQPTLAKPTLSNDPTYTADNINRLVDEIMSQSLIVNDGLGLSTKQPSSLEDVVSELIVLPPSGWSSYFARFESAADKLAFKDLTSVSAGVDNSSFITKLKSTALYGYETNYNRAVFRCLAQQCLYGRDAGGEYNQTTSSPALNWFIDVGKTMCGVYNKTEKTSALAWFIAYLEIGLSFNVDELRLFLDRHLVPKRIQAALFEANSASGMLIEQFNFIAQNPPQPIPKQEERRGFSIN